MQYQPPLQKARLLRRYKRFLADVQLQDGSVVTVHCPNTGSMRNCIVENSDCWIADSNNAKRKYRYTWEIATTPKNARAGINTHRANALVKEGIESGLVTELQGYATLQKEVTYGREGSRIDFLLTDQNRKPPCYVEVKSVTLQEDDGCGYFPDAVSVRASKHLRELIHIVEHKQRAVLFFCVQHSKINAVKPADHIDPAYGEQLRAAVASGVEVIAYKAALNAKSIALTELIPVLLN